MIIRTRAVSARTVRADPYEQVRSALRHRLAGGDSSDQVLADFVEDDLREGRTALAEIEGHFTDVVDALLREGATPADLVAVADSGFVLERVDYLCTIITNLRRRLGHLAARSAPRPLNNGVSAFPRARLAPVEPMGG